MEENIYLEINPRNDDFKLQSDNNFEKSTTDKENKPESNQKDYKFALLWFINIYY